MVQDNISVKSKKKRKKEKRDQTALQCPPPQQHNDPHMVQEHSTEGAEVKHATQWPTPGAGALYRRCRGQACHAMTHTWCRGQACHAMTHTWSRGQACHAMTHTWCRSTLWKGQRSSMPRNDLHMVQEHSMEGAEVKHATLPHSPGWGLSPIHRPRAVQTAFGASSSRRSLITMGPYWETKSLHSSDTVWGSRRHTRSIAATISSWKWQAVQKL